MRVISALFGLLCLGIAMAQSEGDLIRNPNFVEGEAGWSLKGGAKYVADGVSLPRSGAKVIQLVNADKLARAMLAVNYAGDKGFVRVRVFQGSNLLMDSKEAGNILNLPMELLTEFEKKVKIVIIVWAPDGVTNIVIKDVRFTIEAFDEALPSGEYVRNAGFEKAASTNSWRLGGDASYDNAIAASGARSMKLVGVSSVKQRFDLYYGLPFVVSCKVRGKTRLMNLSLGNEEETDEQLSFIDQSQSSWKRWAKLYPEIDDSNVDLVVESSAGGFGYVDDCSMKQYWPYPVDGVVDGGVTAGPFVFRSPNNGKQWMRNGGLENGFESWFAYVRTPWGGFDDGYGDEIRLSLFGENEGPRSGVFSAYMKAQVYLYQRFVLPTGSDFLLVCEVTDRSQTGAVFFLSDDPSKDVEQVLGYTEVRGMNQFGKRQSRFEFSTGAERGVYSVGISQGLDSYGYVDNCSLKEL